MSKSYDNTVPLFEGGAKGLRDALAKVVTDSRLPGEPKDADSSHLVSIFEAFASDTERVAFRAELQAGMGWGDAKAHVVARIERDLGPMRARYAELIAHPERIEETLLEGARKARLVAAPFLAELRNAVGLRRMVAVPVPVAAAKAKVAVPSFKQYREADGKFYFKLAAADGRVLLQSAAIVCKRAKKCSSSKRRCTWSDSVGPVSRRMNFARWGCCESGQFFDGHHHACRFAGEQAGRERCSRFHADYAVGQRFGGSSGWV